NYLSRNNLLRASAALGHPIVLGYISAIGLGLYLYFYPKIQKKMRQQYWIGITVFIGGLLASLSRGPWVGAVAMILVFLLTGQKAIGKLTKLMFGGFFVLAILSTTQAGKSFIELIPFVSNDENIHAVSTISYRQQLLDQSWIVIKRNPFFGSANYLDTPEMETMRQGEGIIDIVNSYLVIALSSGLIGLGLFLSIFAAILYKMYKLMPTLKQNIKFRDLLVMDRALFATIIGVMVTIFTMSGISISQQYYWSLLGLACAFIRIAKTEVINHILETNRR
ncbi:MAG TPA: O-antigen ligase family protein, partial [Emcibacteraceae bacterium]|nr:O-antigen ligase family protein [Emcibacteraceae bacterium]